jgi:predicted ester cyclase
MLSCCSMKTLVRFCLLMLALVVFSVSGLADEAAHEAHKTAIQQLYDDVFNEGDLDTLDTLLASDYVNHGYTADLTRDDFRATIEAMRAALPDFEAEVEVLIAEGEWAASRVVFRGTFENEWLLDGQTIAPNGKPVEWALNTLHRFNEDDQLVEDFTAFDALGLLTQLDAAPLPTLIANVLTSVERTPAVIGELESDEFHDTYQEVFTHIIEDAINEGDLTAIDTYMGEDHQTHEPFGNLTRDQFKQVIAGFRATVPDLHVTIDALVIEGNWLAARLTYTGTFTNEINAGIIKIKPTNQPLKFIINLFVHYEAGSSIEDFKEYNRLGWLRQLTLLPPAP